MKRSVSISMSPTHHEVDPRNAHNYPVLSKWSLFASGNWRNGLRWPLKTFAAPIFVSSVHSCVLLLGWGQAIKISQFADIATDRDLSLWPHAYVCGHMGNVGLQSNAHSGYEYTLSQGSWSQHYLPILISMTALSGQGLSMLILTQQE